MNFAILIVASYLLGSVPFGVIIAAAHGKNLRKIGSGNIGATNLSRALGKKWAYLCFCLDVGKGLAPMIVARKFIPSSPNATELFFWLIVGVAAVLGHVFPIYLKFKGGKGVATSLGLALGLWPYYTLCAAVALAVWVVVVLIWRYISLGSIIASVVFPVTLIFMIAVKSQWHFAELWPLLTAAVAIPPMIILRHRENIKRIATGTESKVLKKNDN